MWVTLGLTACLLIFQDAIEFWETGSDWGIKKLHGENPEF